MKYLFDTNCFISAWHNYYPIDVFPSLWNKLKDDIANQKILILEEVYNELKKGKDDLVNWIKTSLPSKKVLLENNEEYYAKVVQIVESNPNYSLRAKETFLGKNLADAYLVGYGIYEKDCIIVTLEFYEERRREIKIPNLLKEKGCQISPYLRRKRINLQELKNFQKFTCISLIEYFIISSYQF